MSSGFFFAVHESAQFTFIGRIGSDPELRCFDSGRSVTKCRLAVSNGRDAESHWFTVEAWNELSQALADLPKGAMVRVVGRASVSTYQRRDGAEAEDWIIKASEVSLVSLPQGGQAPAPAPAPQPRPARKAAPLPADLPF